MPAQLKLAAIYAVGDKGSPFPVAMDTEASFRCAPRRPARRARRPPRLTAGLEVTPSPALLRRWHLKAAEAGHGEAMFFVANSYQFEHGCPRDYKARPPASTARRVCVPATVLHRARSRRFSAASPLLGSGQVVRAVAGAV